MKAKGCMITLLAAICISSSFGRYIKRQSRAQGLWDPYDALNSWPASFPNSDEEWMEERRSVPIGFSAVRGKRARDPQNAALVSALMKLAKMRSREADFLQDDAENEDQISQFSRYGQQNVMDTPNYHSYEVKRSHKNYIPTERREVPQGFFIARGRKRADDLDMDDDQFRFFSARGKKSHNPTNSNYDPNSFDSLNRRALPEGFYMSRGKRDLEVPTYGADAQKLPVMKPNAA